MIALADKPPSDKEYDTSRNEHVCGYEVAAKPAIAVIRKNVVLALGETKLQPAEDGCVRSVTD